ncbi:MAG: selenium-binding family protein [Planctomycetaceae bacterium]|nr:selenium-binding family protein [Planctomycetaceae bacterium]
MDRRQFLTSVAAGGSLALSNRHLLGHDHCEDRTFATPEEARKSPPEKIAYVIGVYAGTGVKQPDYLVTVDLDPTSKTYSKVIHRLKMPNVGDELHHFGWNACGSCHGHRARRHLIVPGLVSGRIHIIDTQQADAPKLHKVIEPSEIVRQTKLTAPHTVHCLADGRIMISMLGDEQLNGPGGFLLLDEEFNIAGRWEADTKGMNFNYDFWYQPRHNVMVSSEWGAPKTTRPGFQLDDVKAGKYGHHLHFWDWSKRRIAQSIDLGEQGLIPLEVRFHHNPESTHGYVGAALSSVMWHYFKEGQDWKAEKVIEVAGQELKGWDFPVPGLISDLVVSLDDRWLYFSNWLHGDVRQYDISNPSKPILTGQVWVGGLLGKAPKIHGKTATGGPQMLQLSLDGKRLYVTDSLVSSWDNQFYPNIAKQGSIMLRVDADTTKGGLTLNDRFFVDFGQEPDGPARAHEMRFPLGDSTSDVWT